MITNSLFQLFREGGPVFMIPLLLLSILSLAVILERIFVLGKRTSLSPDSVGKIRTASVEMKNSEIVSQVKDDRSLAALIIHDAFTAFQSGKGTMALDQAITESAEAHMEKLNDHLWMLRAIGHIAPLLGLLGTVVGLAIAFRRISEIGLSQQSVAGGISVALITTITGLGIALPTLFADYCLRAWAQSQFKKIKSLLFDIVNWYGNK
jgi:biopolymer transport protein ExbB